MAIPITYTAAQFLNNDEQEIVENKIGFSSDGDEWTMWYAFTAPVECSRVLFNFKLVGSMPDAVKIIITLSDTMQGPAYVFHPKEDGTVDGLRYFSLPANRTCYLGIKNALNSPMVSYITDLEMSVVPSSGYLFKAEDGTIGEKQTIIADGFTEAKKTITYSVGEISGTIAENVDNGVYEWIPPDILASQNTTGTSVECTLTCVSVDGNSTWEQTQNVVYVIPSRIKALITDILTTAVNGSLGDRFDGLYVQGRSRMKLTYAVSTENAQGATVSSYETTVGRTVSKSGEGEYLSSIFPEAGMVSIKGKIVDTRGFSDEKDTQINVEAYAAPVLTPVEGASAIVCGRATEDGVTDVTGVYLKIRAGKKFSPVAGANRCLMRYRVTEDGQSPGEWITLLAMGSDANEVSLITGDTLVQTSAYTVELNVVDDVGESMTLTYRIPTLDVPLHLGRGGKNIGIGRYCDYNEPYRVDVGWDVYLDNGVRLHPFPGEEEAALAAFGYKKPLVFIDVVAESAKFTEDAAYESFPFRAAVELDGALSDMRPEVVFGVIDAMNGNFAPVAESYDGGVYIYAAEKPEAAVTIPVITLWR